MNRSCIIRRTFTGIAITATALLLSGCGGEPVFNALGKCVKNCNDLVYVGKRAGGAAAGGGGIYCAETGDCYRKR
jgi:hypothetical protein